MVVGVYAVGGSLRKLLTSSMDGLGDAGARISPNPPDPERERERESGEQSDSSPRTLRCLDPLRELSHFP